MKAGPDFQKAANAPADHDATFGRLGDSAEDFKERALASPVATNDSDYFAFLYLETNPLQGPKLLDVAPDDLAATQHLQGSDRGITDRTPDEVAQGHIPRLT